jgi:uncharacterized protein YqeY
MSIRDDIQNGIKEALRAKETLRLDCLRMAKGALLVKEKAGPKDQKISDDDAIIALRSEVKKRQQTMETYTELGKTDEVDRAKAEIGIIEEFLPQQLSAEDLEVKIRAYLVDPAEDLEVKIRAYLADHPDVNHPGKLTGAMKKELGDTADGRMLNEICRKVLG